MQNVDDDGRHAITIAQLSTLRSGEVMMSKSLG